MSDIAIALDRTLNGPHTLNLTLDLQVPHKFIIFSDQHKGAGDKADEFRKCMPAYRAALHRYQREGFKLVLLGDVEELWKQGFRSVERTYEQILALEGSFPSGYYYRIWGNHDDLWDNARQVNKRLRRYIGDGALHEAICLQVVDQGQAVGRLLLVHGHQGTLASDRLRWLGPLGLRFFRYLQLLVRIGQTTPAKDACLRDKHETHMYEWAVSQEKLILLTGHTHRPVWSSRTHLQKLEQELAALKSGPNTAVQPQLVTQKEAEIAKRKAKNPPCNETIKISPAYFNSGCCCFDDGDITGIELEDGVLRLVKWAREGNGRVVFEEDLLTGIFESLT